MSTNNILKGFRTKTIMVPIKKIKTNTFVRSGINHDRVALLTTLKDGGTVLDPIILIPDYEVGGDNRIIFLKNNEFAMVDGRHRLWMEDQSFDSQEIKAIVILDGIETEEQLISLAFRCNNTGGPLQPDQEDIEHTVEQLLEKNIAKKDIPKLLCLPDKAVRKFIADVEQRVYRAKTQRAFQRVIKEGLSVPQAATSEGIDAEKLRNYIASGRRKRKTDEIEDLVREISRAFKSLNSKVQTTMRELFKKFDRGDLIAEDIFTVLKKFAERNKHVTRSIDDLHERFKSKAVPQKK